MSPATRQRPAPSRTGFTLTELLVVILIVVLVSAATIPAVLPALNARRVSDASRIIQSELARARDAAVRGNGPRGFRLIPDPITIPNTLTSSRLIALEPAPDYEEGELYLGQGTTYGPPPMLPAAGVAVNINQRFFTYLQMFEVKNKTFSGVTVPAPPTSWYWNLRQGDKIRLHDSGRHYTVVGPMFVAPTISTSNVILSTDNSERFINAGYSNSTTYPTGLSRTNPEILWVLNGIDDDGDGFVDEQFDGIDNDGDGIIDPGFNRIDDDGVNGVDDRKEMYLHKNPDGTFSYPGYELSSSATPAEIFAHLNAGRMNEFEFETFTGKVPPSTGADVPVQYTVERRPVPTEGSREVALPTGVVIDLTTGTTGQPERSRLPIDSITGFVDIMVAPNGQILTAGAGTNLAPPVNIPFYHFWITERDDVFAPSAPPTGFTFQLPMPEGTVGDPRIDASKGYPSGLPTLKRERRLLSVNTRSGQITSTAAEVFYANNPSYPFEAAESGVKDIQP